MFPFLRPDEVRESTNPTPGVCVITADRRRYWFPGSTPDLALSLARPALGDIINDPNTTIDFGTRDGPTFVRERRIAGPSIQPGD